MSKRLVAAAAAVAALFAAAALAQPAPKTYTDSQNRFTFQYPASLPIDIVARPNQPVNILVGAAAYECQMFVVERPEFAGKPPADVARAYARAFGPEVWKQSADGFVLYKRAGTVQSNVVDTSKFWPVQRANLQTDQHTPVIAAMQSRPGIDVWQFCTSFDNADHTAVFNQIINSFAGPNDAALQAEATAADAAHAAAQAAADAAQAEAQAAEDARAAKAKKRRN